MPATLAEPSTLPDYTHWARMARWSIPESAALSLDIDPEAIDTGDLADATRTALTKRVALVMNHARTGRLAHLVEPAGFLSWTASNAIPCSQRLKEAVKQHSGPIADWRHLAETLTTRCEAYEHRVVELESLLRARDEWTPAVAAKSKKPALSPNEARSVKKLILGMAMARYGYRPDGGRTQATRQIVESLAGFGITIDEQTALDWLRCSAGDIEHAIPD
ncbi:hypothetical protein [Terricaulis silvestris]|uniref:Uncharacterized protein n=1 Tax=Terricaulis silvestris TaxID=2686094 RepID=A0A6I6MK02_9CAUL|nr:hypothetical protein [Terricaulis silvestris]QGZ93426.1 hypothetical protein DSM104635_00236 [Terricaulis silvestris]